MRWRQAGYCNQPAASGKLLRDGLTTLRLSASHYDTGHHFASSNLQDSNSAEYLNFQDPDDDSDLGEAETLVVCSINDSVLSNCPRVEVSVRDIVISSIIDTGAQASILSERAYNELVTAGVGVLVLPLQNLVLINAFGTKSKRVRNQAFLEFKLGEDEFEHVFLVTSQLASDMILGCDFCSLHGVVLDFNSKCMEYARGGVRRTITLRPEYRDGSSRSRTGRARFVVQQYSVQPVR